LKVSNEMDLGSNIREMFLRTIFLLKVTTGPLRGGHDTYVAHGENEFDTPDLDRAHIWLAAFNGKLNQALF